MPAPVNIKMRCDFLMSSIALGIELYSGNLSRCRMLANMVRDVKQQLKYQLTDVSLRPEENMSLLLDVDLGVPDTGWGGKDPVNKVWRAIVHSGIPSQPQMPAIISVSGFDASARILR